MSGNHKGGFGEPMSGFDSEGNPLTVSFGWGSREGETLLADGTDQTPREFMQHGVTTITDLGTDQTIT